MPIVLSERLHERWLDPEFRGKEPLLGMLNGFHVENVLGTSIGEPNEMKPSKPREEMRRLKDGQEKYT